MIEAGLAAYRITRFIVADTIFDRPRDRVHNWLLARGHIKVLEGLSCGYCVSVWVSFFVALVKGPRTVKKTLAISGIAALVWSVDRLAVNAEEATGHLETIAGGRKP